MADPANNIEPTPRHRGLRRPLPSPEYLRSRLRYDPEIGKLFWLSRTDIPDDRGRRIWNTRYAGREAFTALSPGGYLHGQINKVGFRAHRIIWAMVYGDCGDLDIDHINHDRADNRLTNLRAVPRIDNLRNKSLEPSNTSGVMGVGWCKRTCQWQSRIMVKQRTIHLGRFKDFDAAVAARKKAELLYGFHPNHGVNSG
ncbi:MAG: hypothetical protein DI555_07135 [Novosphingobium pentaromativorans]|uniref:HNH nuclease domain-containing protein n=1 Tax=Novosphingobium pentaromativorans TaxID=205844 RepID=A0A2W5QMB6_9SPHN|nr:MAG: hypothetical protein DI555_07135 [Novosphingobium pentaromativorans]